MTDRPHTFTPEGENHPSPRPASDRSKLLVGGALGAALVALGAGVLWLATVKTPAGPTPLPLGDQTLPLVAPHPTRSLDRTTSDERIREAARGLSGHQAFRTWLKADDLARRLAATVGAIAQGESPREPLSMLAPAGGFAVIESDAGAYIAPSSFARYDTVAHVVGSLDPQKIATAWSVISPVVRLAWAEIAPPGSHVEHALARALDRLAATPVPTGPIAVTPRGAIWAFDDPALESLSAAEKHLVRMGPVNQRLIQTRATELRKALDLTVM